LSLPAIKEAGAILAVAVKMDMEAFDAGVETSDGLEYDRGVLEETCMAWSDRQARFAWVPTHMAGGALFRGPHLQTPPGTVVRIRASGAFRAYVVVEKEYKGGKARDGGFIKSLPECDWRAESSAPSWDDNKSEMQTFTRMAPEGTELALPATVGEAVFSVTVVNIAATPERLAVELKQTFKSWDPESKGGLRRQDLDSLLRQLCPTLAADGREALLDAADRHGTGKIGYDDFVSFVVLGGSA